MTVFFNIKGHMLFSLLLHIPTVHVGHPIPFQPQKNVVILFYNAAIICQCEAYTAEGYS